MRPSALVACALVLSACGGRKTCEDLLLPDLVADYFEVDLANESGGILVEFVPAAAAEVWVEDDTGAKVWHVRCDVDEELGEGVPACLTSPLEIGDDAPAGASNPTETQDLADGPVYHAEVRDYDAECDGQIRSGASAEFTVTISSPF